MAITEVRCSLCTNYTFVGGEPINNRAGLGRCKFGPVWEFPNPYIERDCAKFKEVDAADRPKREAFLAAGTCAHTEKT